MSFTVQIRGRAKMDLINLADYYENARQGFGVQFINDFEKHIVFLETNAYRGSNRYKDFREFAMRRFPVIIIYKVIGKEITVFSVFQANQNPEKKYFE